MNTIIEMNNISEIIKRFNPFMRPLFFQGEK